MTKRRYFAVHPALVLGSMILGSLVAGSLLYQAWTEFDRNGELRREIAAVHNRRFLLGELERVLLDAQAGQRSYLATRDVSDLNRYHMAVAQAPILMERIRTSTWMGDERRQVAPLIALAQEKLQELKTAVDRPVISVERQTGAGATLMEEIRNRSARLRAEQLTASEQLLIDTATTQSNFSALLAILAAATVVISALGGFISRRQAILERARGDLAEMAAKQRKELNEALSRANELLAVREAQAKALSHAKTRFLAAASHDMRQPLHAMALHISALQRRVLGGEALEIVQGLKGLCEAQRRMFATLLDVARIDAGVVVSSPEPLSLTQVFEALTPEFQSLAAEAGLRLRARTPPLVVSADRTMLETMLRNIVGNAIKFTRRGGVLVSFRKLGDYAALDVWDTGPGIPKAQFERIFLEFERLEGTTRTPGLGLGLAIVARFSALMGAPVTVCSLQGRGSRFRITLPLALDPSRQPATPAAEDADGDARGLSVLIVDDDPTIVAALARELVDLGCSVVGVGSADEARAAVSGGMLPNLLLLDLNLGPQSDDGLMLAKDLLGRLPFAGALLLSGSTEPEAVAQLEASGLPWLTKPVPPELLHRHISAAARSQQAQAKSL